MSEKKNAQKIILQEVGRLLEPITHIAENPDKLDGFFKKLGWDINNISGFPLDDLTLSISTISSTVDTIKDLIETPPESLEDLKNIINTFSNLFQALDELVNVIDTPAEIPSSLKLEFKKVGEDIVSLLTTNYLFQFAPKLYGLFSLLGIIDASVFNSPSGEIINLDDNWVKLDQNLSKVRYDNIESLFEDPIQYLKDQFLGGADNINSDLEAKQFSDIFFPKLRYLLYSLGIRSRYQIFPDDSLDIENRTLSINYPIEFGLQIGLRLFFALDVEGNYALHLKPTGDFNFSKTLNDWVIQMGMSSSIDDFSISHSNVNFPIDISSVNLDVDLYVLRFFTDQLQEQQIGSTNGTRLEIGGIAFRGFGNFENGKIDYGIEAFLKRMKLVVGGGEGDGFLNKIFKEPIEIDFDLMGGWSKKLGFYFRGSASLELVIPVHKTVLGLKIETIFIVLTFKDGGLIAEISADTGIELGPFSASVSRLGLASNMQFERGNLGFMNADLKFKPPSGIGLSIDASAVKGGGYLFFNHEEQKYAGVAELSVKDKISLKVVGILTTKLPGKDDGYSLLLLVTAEFTPINLAFGFTLNGVGGLVAINRTMNLQALRDGVKNNSIDNVMFPDDPVANAPQIISDLETIFPIQEGRYAFGVMGLIGWGTPTLITMEIGLMLEVPKPVRLAILGVVKAIMPEVEEGKESLLQIQINFVGTIDFEAKYITFDASIFDSKFVKFTLSGDMAFRLKWGDEPNFLLSVGGFHPAYTPPPLDLPSMNRLTISLLGEEDPRLTLSTYFAITSNTVQFGALLDFYYSVTNNVEVLGNLGFDVLIQFSPFYLRADLYATLAVVYKKEAVMAVSLYGMLEGPAPWHAVGKAEFTFLKLKLKASFDKTFGEEENTELPDKEVAPLLIAEGSKSDNWEGMFPAASNLLVSLKKQEPVEGVILSHPNGSLRFSQKIVPLETTINKFGKQEPADYKHFSVSIANEAGVDFDSNVTKEFFAPADFIELSDTQKLTRKSFEKMNSGVAISGSDNYESSFYLGRSLEYEHVVYDNVRQGEQLDNVLEAQIPFNAFSRNNTSARSTFGSLKKPGSNFEPNKVHLSDDAYTIAELEGLSLYLGDGGEYSFGSEAEAYETLERIIEENPGLTDKIDVVPTYEFA